MLLPTLAGLQIATQLTAAAFGYHPALGGPSVTLGHWRLYAPWCFAQWLWAFGQQQPQVFNVPLYVATGGVVVGMLLVWLTMLARRRQAAPTTYGSAIWASARDVKRSGLL